MTRAPQVSVLVPVRDAVATLGECLDSVLAQEGVAFEVVVVDDGSRDGSATVAEGRGDPRVRVLRPGPLGLVGALNLGLEAARGPLVARMDADDRMCPGRLAAQCRYLSAHPEVTVVGGRVRLFPPEQVRAGMRAYLAWQDRCATPAQVAAAIYREAPLVHPSVTLRRDAVRAAGGYREGDFPEDYELWLRLHRTGHGLARLEREVLEWRLHPGSLSRRDGRYRREAFDALRADYLAADPRLAAGRPLVFWGAGRVTRRRSRLLMERGHHPVAYVDIDPRKLGNRVAGVPVVPPGWLRREPRPLVLVYVASHGAPEAAAAVLEAMGYADGRDFLIVG